MINQLKQYTGHQVVLDTSNTWVYIGTLETVTDSSVILIQADAHDTKDTVTSKEAYVYDARTAGLKPNRDRLVVNLAHVVSFSALSDIKKFSV
jgi:hypothetical protein